MNALRTAFLLLALLLAVRQAPAKDAAAEENTAIEGDRAARMILVTFADSTINRVKSDASGNRYQRRGYYRKSTWSTRVADEISATYRLKQVNEWPISELGVYCVVYEAAGNEPLEAVLETLRRDERIDSAQAMYMFHTMGNRYRDPYYRLQDNLRTMQIEAAHRSATGRGIKIAVIDTGVDFEHPDLKGQIAEHRDFTAQNAAQFSGDLHGTAVAGVIGALAGNGEGIVGVAPNAEILALKACWQTAAVTLDAACNSLTLALALNTAIRMKPHILNLSLTGPPDPLLKQLLEKALANGIIVVAAADQTGTASGFPASLPGVIAAYAAEQTGNPPLTGQKLRLAAPGSEIVTTFPHGAYSFMSGSSIAAAQLSGVIALLLELHAELTADVVAGILSAGTASRPNETKRTATLAPVNAEAAIMQLSATKYAASEKKHFLD
jgi:subtilisin family serine protease